MAKTIEESRASQLWAGITTRVGKNRNYLTSENLFTSKSDFIDWCIAEENFMSKDETNRYWAIDKDIIVPFNKSYSPSTCCFVPQSINVLFRNNTTGKTLKGVTKNLRGYTKFKSSITVNGDEIILGYFKDEFEAHQAWQQAFIDRLNSVVKENKYNLSEKILKGIHSYSLMIQLALNQNAPTTNITR